MNAREYKELDCQAFVDQHGTKFVKGPFDVEGVVYDYKLIDKNGEDYCTAKQIEDWYCDVVKKEFNK